MFERDVTGGDNGKNAQCRRSVTPVTQFPGWAKEDSKAKQKPLHRWSTFVSRLLLQSHYCSVLNVFSVGISLCSVFLRGLSSFHNMICQSGFIDFTAE